MEGVSSVGWAGGFQLSPCNGNVLPTGAGACLEPLMKSSLSSPCPTSHRVLFFCTLPGTKLPTPAPLPSPPGPWQRRGLSNSVCVLAAPALGALWPWHSYPTWHRLLGDFYRSQCNFMS